MPQGFSLGDETQSLEIVESETVYRGAIWDVRRETFDYRGEKLTRDFVDHPGAVSIVALNDNAEIMMIRQYRHAIRALDWEIPAGLLDIPGEDPLVCAQRELVEEADLEADTWQHLTRLNTTPGGSNESTHIFLATDRPQTSGITHGITPNRPAYWLSLGRQNGTNLSHFEGNPTSIAS